jgi:hypothetical protein
MQALWCIIMSIVMSRLRWVEKGAVVDENCQRFQLSDEAWNLSIYLTLCPIELRIEDGLTLLCLPMCSSDLLVSPPCFRLGPATTPTDPNSAYF